MVWVYMSVHSCVWMVRGYRHRSRSRSWLLLQRHTKKKKETPGERIPARQPGGNKNKLMFSSVRHFECGHRCGRQELEQEQACSTHVPHGIAYSFLFCPIRLPCCRSAICSMMQCGRFLFMIAQIS